MTESDLKVSVKDIWPQERDYFERPERFKYVRKIIRPSTCVFCTSASEKISFETLCLYKTKLSMVVANKYPYNSGHLLVLPLRHCGDLLKLTPEEYTDLSEVLKVSFKVLNDVYQCSGFNLGMNHGEVAGAGIPEHLHWHIIPRWLGDTNFFPLIAETKALPETLDQVYQKLKHHFDKIEA